MTQRHRAAELLRVRRHLNWRRADWNRVLFTDESRFTVSHADGRLRVYRRKNKKNRRFLALLRRKGLGRERNGLGVIMGNRKTDLVVVQGNSNAQRYVADMLNAYALPFIC